MTTFPLANAHSRAHFHLRLLNAADPRMRQFTVSQQAQMGRLWEQFSDIAIIQYESPRYILVQSEDGHATKKRKLDGSIGLPELSSSSLVTNVEESGRRGIYFITLKTGHRYIRKTFGRSGKQEIEIYRCLQEFDIHQPPHEGITHFIPEWSTGYWSAGKYLQLPRLISVGNELKKAESWLDGQALSLCAQLLNGIAFLHFELDVAHMDIKPDNFVLDVGPHALPMLKIIDFNLSFMDASSKVACGVRGTKGYMAPEVQEGKRYRPLLADQYSCGVCMRLFLERGRDQENCDDCYETFAFFADKLCSWFPNKRPSLMERPQ